MPIHTTCDECGAPVSMPPSRYARSKKHFCCNKCHMQNMNRELNPLRMTEDVRQKLALSRLGTGEGKSYRKTFGKHTHRLVAEQMPGRPLKKGETVHHINGDKRDNRPENLMVFASQAEHARWHAEQKRKERR